MNITESITTQGSITAAQGFSGPMARSNITAENSAVLRIPFPHFRVWDAVHTPLPAVGAADDIGLARGTFGTGIWYLKSQDMNGVGAVTEYAAFQVTLPANYVAYSQLYLRACMGMLTAAAATSNTIDFEAYLCGRTALVSGSDLVTTTAQSNTTTTLADKDFTLTSSGLTAGATLDCRVTMACNSATASSHFAICSHIELIYTFQG